MSGTQYFFLGGIFADSQVDLILKNSRGVVQNAADAFQKKIIYGLDATLNEGVVVLNLPFVGSYPSLFRLPFLPKVDEAVGGRSRINGCGFINVFGIRIVSRLISSFKLLFSIPECKQTVLFVYSAHLPFVLSAVIFRCLRKSIKICLILPDLPEYMGDNAGFLRCLKWLDVKIFYILARFFDRYVFLTEYMADKLNVPQGKYVVVEGIANHEASQFCSDCADGKSFLYTGTLAKRYGVMDLVSAFSKIDDKYVELWICGDGDAKEEVIAASRLDSRIRYYGQLDRNSVLNMQTKASFLINPRAPDGDYTRYSFPSKILEYMSTGKPVIMYKLDGVPLEYDGLYISPRGVGVDMLSECMVNVLAMSHEDLLRIGADAKRFVFLSKTPAIQAQKIVNVCLKG